MDEVVGFLGPQLVFTSSAKKNCDAHEPAEHKDGLAAGEESGTALLQSGVRPTYDVSANTAVCPFRAEWSLSSNLLHSGKNSGSLQSRAAWYKHRSQYTWRQYFLKR